MPVILRRRVQCHYCGRRLNTSQRAGNKIRCAECLADNYFDAEGNLTDVPVEDVKPTASTGAPDYEVASESSIFCSTCLKNQHLYVTALSEYLPDTDDPNYNAIEAALPAFKQQLELRYPQCCARCEPKVQQQLQQANYAAKSDHLRRTLEKRRKVAAASRLQWKCIFVSMTGLGYTLSLVVQLLWHVLSSQLNTDLITPDIATLQCLSTFPIPKQCTTLIAHYVPWSLFLGLSCIWWNPKWQHKLMQREGRLVGLDKYYQAQAYIIALRFLAWILLVDVPGLDRHRPPLHALSAILIGGTTIWAVTTIITVDTKPLVDWSQAPQPLTRAGQFTGPVLHAEHPVPAQPSENFPVQDLAGPQRPSFDAWRPPTPPLGQGDDMDWTPSQSEFHPRTNMHIPKREDPSPFFGNLPAAPSRGSLDPKRTVTKQSNTALGIPPGFFGLSKSSNADQPSVNYATRENVRPEFAPPKLFLPDRDADTGLEGIFDQIFSVRDDAAQRQAQTVMQGQRGSKSAHTSATEPDFDNNIAQLPSHTATTILAFRKLLSCFTIVILSILAVNLGAIDYLFTDGIAVPSMALPYLTPVPVLHLIDELVSQPHHSLAGLLPLLIEATILPSSYIFIPESATQLVPLWNKLVIGAACLLLIQEIYYFARLQVPPSARGPRLQNPATSSFVETTTEAQSHPSPLPSSFQPSHSVPTSTQSTWDTYPASPLKNRDSNESIGTTTSVNTTSTAPGWKTPRMENRSFDFGNEPRRSTRSVAKGPESRSLTSSFGGLGLESGNSIAGPRTRGNDFRNSAFGRY